MSPTIRDEPPHELADVQAGLLPGRYGRRMQDTILEELRPRMVPGGAVLDVGSGRAPTVAPEDRPAGCRYTGLDVSGEELSQAEAGAYTDTIVADITQPLGIREEYDLAISWQVLEHVKPIDAAFANLHAALRPGGTMLAHLSGSRAAFALVARALPHRARVAVMSRLLGHPAEEKFPTHFDRCHAAALERMLSEWRSVKIVPFYRGATYFGFSRPLQRAYLAFENRIERAGREGLATHYLIVSEK